MKSFLKSVPDLLIILVVSHFLLSCGSLHYRPDYKTKKFSNKSTSNWQTLDKKNYLVVHSGEQMREMYNVQFDDETGIISSELKAFEALPLEYYKIVSRDKSNNYHNRKIPGASKEIYEQHHFFLDKSISINGDRLNFSYEDIEHVEVLQHSNKALIVLLAVGGSALIMFLLAQQL